MLTPENLSEIRKIAEDAKQAYEYASAATVEDAVTLAELCIEMLGHIDNINEELSLWRQVPTYDIGMQGPVLMGVNGSALRRAWEKMRSNEKQ